jgi:hypothetical protein
MIGPGVSGYAGTIFSQWRGGRSKTQYLCFINLKVKILFNIVYIREAEFLRNINLQL